MNPTMETETPLLIAGHIQTFYKSSDKNICSSTMEITLMTI